MAQNQQPPMVLRLIEKPRLLLENAQRLQVCRHVPRHLQVRSLRHQVAGHGAGQLARAKDHDLAAGGVAAHLADMHPRYDLSVTVEVLNYLVSVVQRCEVVAEVTGLAPHVGMHGEVPLAALDEMARSLERQLQGAVLIASREAAGMIPVEVRRDHGVDLLGPDAQALQRCLLYTSDAADE